MCVCVGEGFQLKLKWPEPVIPGDGSKDIYLDLVVWMESTCTLELALSQFLIRIH